MSEWMSDWVSETGWINEGVNDINDQWINSRLCKQINEWKNWCKINNWKMDKWMN